MSEQIGWAVLELMGHRKLAGKVAEATLAGGSFLRIDVYLADDGELQDGQEQVADEDGAPLKRIATQFYPPGSVYCLTPTNRETCLALSKGHQPAPVARWELPAAAPGVEPDYEERY